MVKPHSPRGGDWTLLEAIGEIRVGASEALLRRDADRLVQAGVRWLLLDLAAVSAIDAAGLGLLVRLRKQLDAVGGELVLLQPRARVLALLAICGLDEVFEVTDLDRQFFDTSQVRPTPATSNCTITV